MGSELCLLSSSRYKGEYECEEGWQKGGSDNNGSREDMEDISGWSSRLKDGVELSRWVGERSRRVLEVFMPSSDHITCGEKEEMLVVGVMKRAVGVFGVRSGIVGRLSCLVWSWLLQPLLSWLWL